MVASWVYLFAWTPRKAELIPGHFLLSLFGEEKELREG
jgi:hypothetical protein